MERFKILSRIFFFIIIGICIFAVLTNILVPKTVYTSIIKGFYKEPKNSLDVVFIGDSSIYEGISPLEMWKNYGFTSYNFASPAQKLMDSYYMINEVLEYQKPKLIVIHAEQLFNGSYMKEGNKRNLYDNVRLGKNKINAVRDETQNNTKKSLLTYVLPFFRFHSRWSSINANDIKYAFNTDYHDQKTFKGYWLKEQVRPYETTENKKLKNKLGDVAISYFEKIKKLCDENDIELLIIAAPMPNAWNEERSRAVAQYASNNNIKFLDTNLYLNEIGIDWNKDTPDKGDHLNINGAKKLSKYVGDYLIKNYSLESHKQDEAYNSWNEELEKYENYISKLNNKK